MSKKMIRKSVAAMFCVLTTAVSCLTAAALGVPVTVKECDNLQLSLPENMTSVTRSSAPDDPYFARHNCTYEDVMDAFKASNGYLQAMDDDNALVINLTYLETSARDFIDMTDEELSELARSFIGGTDPDVQYNAATQDQAGQEMVWLFLNMDINDQNGKGFSQYQATTVVSGMNISLTMYRNGTDVLPTDYDILESVVRSVRPPQVFPLKRYLPYILITLGAAAIIALLVIIVRLLKNREPRQKEGKTENDRILEELANKYKKRGPVRLQPQTEETDGDEAPQDGADTPDETADEAPQNGADTPDEPADEAPEAEEDTANDAKKQEEPAAEADASAAQEPEEALDEAASEEAPDEPAEDSPKAADTDTDEADGNSDGSGDDDGEPRRKYSDEDIERLLAD